ncbi:MAG TPA: sugar MFS transporter [Steroidobacteraceae bacterium]
MENNNRRLTSAFIAVTTLFFAWGFITSMIDPLIALVRKLFSLTTTESMLTQFAYFMAYGVVSLPGAALVSKVGYSRSILYALVVILAGCLFIPVATALDHYELVLVGLFVIASGVTILQVAANPLAAALGRPERSHFRLTFSQAFNSLGTVIGPLVGAELMLQGGVFGADDSVAISPQMRAVSLRSIDTSFLAFAAMLALLTIFIWTSRRLIADAAPVPAKTDDSVATALRSRWAILGAVAIFLYVGAEVSIGSNLNFLFQRKDVLGLTPYVAGKVVPFYWLGAMVGRFVGSALLTRIKAGRLLAAFAAVNAVLCLTVWLGNGYVAAGGALVAGLFNSIMFPTIFTITLERSTASAAATSGLLCVAIIGGALLPPLTGFIADKADMHVAFLVPMVAYFLISLFASAASKARVGTVGAPATSLADQRSP